MVSRILLIDDNELDQFINSTLLNRSELVENTISFTSAIEALKYLKDVGKEFPEVILLDIKMPEMCGFEFLAEYAKITNPLKEMCRVFMLSSSHDPVDVMRAKESPLVIDYLNKPLNLDLLEQILID
jgi:CheY-like chemotaxis protein